MDLRGEITSFLARLEREHESGEKEAELMEIMRTDVELCVRVTCQLFCSELLHLSSYQSNLLLSCLRQTVEEEARDDKHASSFLRSLLCLPHLRQGMVPRVASVVALLVGLNASVFLLFKEYFCEILPRSEESVKIALLSVMDVCADRVKGDRDLLLLLFPLLDHPSPIIVGSTLHLLDNVFRTEDEVSIYFLRRALVTGVTSPPNVDLVEDQDVHSSPLRVVDGSALFHLKEVRQEEEEEEESACSVAEEFLLQRIPYQFPPMVKAALFLLDSSSSLSLRMARRALLLFGPGGASQRVAGRLFAAMREEASYQFAMRSFKTLVPCRTGRKEEEEEDGRKEFSRTAGRRFLQLLRSFFLHGEFDMRGWDGSVRLQELMDHVEELKEAKARQGSMEVDHRFLLESSLLVLENSSWSASSEESDALVRELLLFLRHPFALRNAWLRRLLVRAAARAAAGRKEERKMREMEEGEEEEQGESLQLLLEVVCMTKKKLWRTARGTRPVCGLLREPVLGASHFLDYLEEREEKEPAKKQHAGFGFGGRAGGAGEMPKGFGFINPARQGGGGLGGGGAGGGEKGGGAGGSSGGFGVGKGGGGGWGRESNLREGSKEQKQDAVQVNHKKAGDEKTFPKPGDRVRMTYSMRLVDGGKEIDSNEQRSKEFSFIFGDGQVIAGLEEGLSRISVGGEATLKISQALAYGEKPIGSLIPARANLLMEVKMIAVNDNDGTVVKHEEGGRLQEEEEEEEERQQFMRYEMEEDAAVRAEVVEGLSLTFQRHPRSLISVLPLLVEGFDDESQMVQEAIRRCLRVVASRSRRVKAAVYKSLSERMKGGQEEGKAAGVGRRQISASARASMLRTLIDLARAEEEEEEERNEELLQQTSELLQISSEVVRNLMANGADEEVKMLEEAIKTGESALCCHLRRTVREEEHRTAVRAEVRKEAASSLLHLHQSLAHDSQRVFSVPHALSCLPYSELTSLPLGDLPTLPAPAPAPAPLSQQIRRAYEATGCLSEREGQVEGWIDRYARRRGASHLHRRERETFMRACRSLFMQQRHSQLEQLVLARLEETSELLPWMEKKEEEEDTTFSIRVDHLDSLSLPGLADVLPEGEGGERLLQQALQASFHPRAHVRLSVLPVLYRIAKEEWSRMPSSQLLPAVQSARLLRRDLVGRSKEVIGWEHEERATRALAALLRLSCDASSLVSRDSMALVALLAQEVSPQPDRLLSEPLGRCYPPAWNQVLVELKEKQAGEEQQELIYPMYVDSSLPYDFAGRERMESYTMKMRQGRRKEPEGWNVCQHRLGYSVR